MNENDVVVIERDLSSWRPVDLPNLRRIGGTLGPWLCDSDATGHRVVGIEWMTRFLSLKWFGELCDTDR